MDQLLTLIRLYLLSPSYIPDLTLLLSLIGNKNEVVSSPRYHHRTKVRRRKGSFTLSVSHTTRKELECRPYPLEDGPIKEKTLSQEGRRMRSKSQSA